MSAKTANRMKIRSMVRIIASDEASTAPEWFSIAPVLAIRNLLIRTEMTIGGIDLFEIHEAFAATALAVLRDLKIPEEKVNLRGGAIALGHPIGASGARILVTLLYLMRDLKKRRGLAALCIGGGEAVAMVVER